MLISVTSELHRNVALKKKKNRKLDLEGIVLEQLWHITAVYYKQYYS